MTASVKEKLIKAGVLAGRIVIGVVFIISGLSKSIDLWGSIYKIEEYLYIWGLTQPRTIVLIGAMGLSCTEFVLGALLLPGCCRRWVPIMMTAIMAFMLPLTLYIYIANPVSDCGCFGDFWIISNGATLWKNVAIVAVLIFLLRFNRRLRPLFTPFSQWIVITLLSAYILMVALYGYLVQPVADFRSFPIGRSLVEDDDAVDDDGSEADVVFIYEKAGERREFGLDNLPDSTWTFIDSRETGVKERSLTELAVYDSEGNDATDDAIAADGYQMLLVIPQPSRAEVSWTYFLNDLNEYMTERGGSMAAFIGGDSTVAADWADLSMASYPVYTAEPTTLKELVRGSMGLVYLHDGKVAWKRSMALIDTTAADAFIFEGHDPDEMAPKGRMIFRSLTVILLLLLFILYIFDSTGRLINKSFLHADEKPTSEDTEKESDQ